MKDEALRLALEALERCVATCFDRYAHEQVMSRPEHFVNQTITAIREALAEQPEFITHEVENAEDWSEWVCPDPKGYLMKCCDCGLVHEAQFGVVRYKSKTGREDCDMVDDPNLQAVFRMRRSEQWSPEDTAHRAGGLPMEQPEPEPVALNEEWVPCVKLPVVVHVRKQRVGEKHISTREGITPVKPDDLIMRGVAGEEYPIGRELWERTYTTNTIQTKREPLTSGEIYTAYITATNQTLRAQDEKLAFAFARAIEAAHGIKGEA